MARSGIRSDKKASRRFPSTVATPDQQIAGVKTPTGGVWIVNSVLSTDASGLLTEPPLAKDVTRTWYYVAR